MSRKNTIPILLLITSLATLLTPLPLRAQPAGPMMPEMPRLFGNFVPRTGVWSEYAVSEKGSGRKSKMRLAVVGKEGESFWYEVRMDEGTNLNIIKMLLKGDPSDPESIQRMIIKTGQNQAMEMPAEFVVMGRRMATQMFESRSGSASSPPSGIRVEEMGRHEVTVPAGTFKIERRRIVDADGQVRGTYDFNAEVLPIGVITSETKAADMELLAYGTDARTMITEEPIKMQPPPGMPGNMPPGMMGVPPMQPPPPGQ